MIEYKLGYFAESLCGHDKGRLYVIVSEEGDRVGLCDGIRRFRANPKYKKKKHVQMARSEKMAEEYPLVPEADKDLWIRERIRDRERQLKR